MQEEKERSWWSLGFHKVDTLSGFVGALEEVTGSSPFVRVCPHELECESFPVAFLRALIAPPVPAPAAFKLLENQAEELTPPLAVVRCKRHECLPAFVPRFDVGVVVVEEVLRALVLDIHSPLADEAAVGPLEKLVGIEEERTVEDVHHGTDRRDDEKLTVGSRVGSWVSNRVDDVALELVKTRSVEVNVRGDVEEEEGVETKRSGGSKAASKVEGRER